MNTLGTNIKNLRLFRGLSQRKLAEKLGKTVNTIANWEKDLSSPDLKTVGEICKALEVTPNELLGWDQNKEYVDFMIELEDSKVMVEHLHAEYNEIGKRLQEYSTRFGKLLNSKDSQQ